MIDTEYFRKAKEYINRLDKDRARLRTVSRPSHPPIDNKYPSPLNSTQEKPDRFNSTVGMADR